MVHQYKLNGYNIVLDTCSGSVHVVDEVAYDMSLPCTRKPREEIVPPPCWQSTASREDVTEADLRQCIDDVASLKEAGKLWSPDTYSRHGVRLQEAPTPWSRRCACMWPTPAT